MSEQMTTIFLPGVHGWMGYGKQSRSEMILRYRANAAYDKAQAERILAAKDSDFVVEQHTGKCVKRNRVVLQPNT